MKRKGLKALNRKLQNKYGETLNTFEEEDDAESLPSILEGMPVVVAGTNSNGRVISLRSGGFLWVNIPQTGCSQVEAVLQV